MDFEKKGYTVLKGVLPEKVANFVYKYFLMKRKVADIFYKNKYIPPNSPEWGIWTDAQVPGTYSAYCYGDHTYRNKTSYGKNYK